MILLVSSLLLVIIFVIFFIVHKTQGINRDLLNKVEREEQDKKEVTPFLINLSQYFDSNKLEWHKKFDENGVEIFTTLAHHELTNDIGVKTYKVKSKYKTERLSVDNLSNLLNGGFLKDSLWYKKDFLGGANLKTIHNGNQQNSWIAQYISHIPFFKNREFVYLVAKKNLEQNKFSEKKGNIKQQVLIGYKSVNFPSNTGKKYIKGTIYPSLDRITEFYDDTIIWEHIVTHHLNGAFTLKMVNNMEKPTFNVLYNEVLNLRKKTF